MIRRLRQLWHRWQFRSWLREANDLCGQGLWLIAETNPTLASVTAHKIEQMCKAQMEQTFVSAQDVYQLTQRSLALVSEACMQEANRRKT